MCSLRSSWTPCLTVLLWLSSTDQTEHSTDYTESFDSPIRKLSLACNCNDRAELMSFIKSEKRTIESQAIAQLAEQLNHEFSTACEFV